MVAAAAEPFAIEVDGLALAGEQEGEGECVVLLHALTATRSGVLHGSRYLSRHGFRTIAYDARGHGDSGPAPAGEGYGYDRLAADLGAVLAERAPNERVVLAGSSMGAHTALAFALEHPEAVAGLVLIGPAYPGTPPPADELARWDELADGLERDGAEGFMAVYATRDHDPRWREAVLRTTRARLAAHRDLDALAGALREVPRSRPFESLDELRFCELPALVVASGDEADPGHPYAVAEFYAEALPHGRLLGDRPGESPLAWQGGRLSRAITAFRGEAAGQRL